jgi:hypothetical protein
MLKLELYKTISVIPFGSIIGKNGSEIILKGNPSLKYIRTGNIQFHDLTIDCEGAYYLDGNIGTGNQLGEMNGSLTIKRGKLHFNSFSIDGTAGESITIEEGASLSTNTPKGFPKGFSNINLMPFSTVNYSRIGTQNIDSLNFWNLEISGVGTKNILGKTTVNGVLDVTFGELQTNSKLTLLSNQNGTGSIGTLCYNCIVNGKIVLQFMRL